MAGFASLFEPEELIGSVWHRIIGNAGSELRYPDAAMSLQHVQHRMEIMFRGLGGSAGVEIKAIAPETVNYRKSLLARIGHGSTAVTHARFDGDFLFLPERIDLLPERDDNERLYKWLTVWAATAGDDGPLTGDDPFRNDISFLRYAVDISERVFGQYPGMKKLHDHLLPALLANRPRLRLPGQEAALEDCIRAMLGGHVPTGDALDIWRAIKSGNQSLDRFAARSGYKTFMPLILWGEFAPRKLVRPGGRDAMDEDGGAPGSSEDERAHKIKREKSDEMERDDSLLLHRFESILSWSEIMNINRNIEDEEEDAAKKAADDHEELGLTNTSRKAATRLKFDLDLAPEDVEHERLAAKHAYPEWDYRKNAYYPDHCRVLAGPAPELEEGREWQPDREARRRIRAVKRQFEALRPKREMFHRQIEGDEIDMDALIRARCDLAANGEGSNRVFSAVREAARDLSVSVLIDTSRSSESWIEGRQVIEISKEALMALAIGLAACGDDNAIYSFSSLRRDRVTVSTLKGFGEALGPQVFSRIGALRPGFYTRLGAALRHVANDLRDTASAKQLLLVLTDGKPNDLDHYEGRYGVEDTAMAVREARRMGIAVFGITIDKKAQSYFPHIFGRNAYAIVKHANGLTNALPLMYRHLVT